MERDEPAEIGLGADAAKIVGASEGRGLSLVQKTKQRMELVASRIQTIKPHDFTSGASAQECVPRLAEEGGFSQPSRDSLHWEIGYQVSSRYEWKS